MEENSEIQEDLGNGGKFKNWLQDNIRIILSVLIVATIAAGIYSYSKRAVAPTDEMIDNAEVVVEVEEADNEDNNAVVVVGEDDAENKTERSTEEKETEKLSVNEVVEDSVENTAEQKPADVEEAQVENKEPAQEEKKEEPKQEVASGEESETAFVEVAEAGDSLTILARRATKHYLEKNPVDGLSKEHKVYIEDYLRRHVGHSAVLNTGDQVSFSKDLIKRAIDASKNLNDKQLKNLQKYSARISNL